MLKKVRKIQSIILAVALLLTFVVVPVSAATPPITPGTEVFTVMVTDTDGSTAVVKDTRTRKIGDSFKITDTKVKKELARGDVILVTKKVSRTGKVSYNYMAGKSRISLGFVKNSKTVIDTTGKSYAFKNNFGAGKIVEIIFDSKFTFESTDDTFKEAKLVGTVAY